MRDLVLATRGSRLALTQAESVAAALRARYPGLRIELRVIHTTGDHVRDRALAQIGATGVFVKEIQAALLAGAADLAVHSCKDLESHQPEALTLAAIPPRADARDALISRHGLTLDALPAGARVGTSSLRRRCQVLHLRPDLEVIDLRGNVDTRLARAAEERYDAIVLAAAGLARLGRSAAITELLPPERFVPMVGQGALAVECRADDHELRALLAPLNDAPTARAVQAERAFLRRLAGGCRVPIAAHALPLGAELELHGLLGTPDGAQVVRGVLRGADAEALGLALAEQLLAAGGAAILEQRHAPLTGGIA
ncbi:hydroxymethylbilane synthase [Kallotenue papyrolyticum]|uniref:hydroxymethylbilane synthase n=1 Tax=Kallotenue papyrolyticum TaxID=1325125 RepID=UPI0004707D2F|nr:hydroxymethylbilane synthase [Kallotenue papyrolyticum]